MQNETQNQNIDSQEAKVEEAAVQTEAPQEPNIGANTDPYRGPEVEEPADITDPKVTMSLDDLVGSDPKVTMNPEDLFGPETTEEPGDVIDIEDISADPLGLGGDGLPDDIIIDNWGSTDWDEIGSRTPEYVPELFEDKPVPTDQVDLLASEAAATPFPEAVSMPTDQEEALPFEPGTGTDPGVIPDHVPDTGVQDPDPTRPDLQQSHTLGTEEGVGDAVSAVGDVPGSAQSPGYESEYASAILGSEGTPNDGGEHVPHPDDWEDEPTQPNHTPHPDDTSIREVPDITHPGGPQPKVIVDPDSEPTVTDAEPLSFPDDDPIWEEAVEVLEDAGQAAQDALTDAAYAIGENVGDAVDTYFDAVDDINEAIYDGVGDAAEAVWDTAGDAAEAVGETFEDAAEAVGAEAVAVAGAVGTGVGVAAGAVWEAGEDAYDAVGDAFEDAGDEIASWFN